MIQSVVRTSGRRIDGDCGLDFSYAIATLLFVIRDVDRTQRLLEGVRPTTLISRTLICADRLACSPDRVACLPRPVSDAARCPAPLSVCARPGAWCAVGNCLFYGMPRPARRSSFSAAGRLAARDSLIMTWDRSASVCTHRVLARASCPPAPRGGASRLMMFYCRSEVRATTSSRCVPSRFGMHRSSRSCG